MLSKTAYLEMSEAALKLDLQKPNMFLSIVLAMQLKYLGLKFFLSFSKEKKNKLIQLYIQSKV